MQHQRHHVMFNFRHHCCHQCPLPRQTLHHPVFHSTADIYSVQMGVPALESSRTDVDVDPNPADVF